MTSTRLCRIPTKKPTFPLVRFSRPLGMVILSSSVVSPSLRSTRLTLSPLPLSWIRNQRPPFQMPETPPSCAALPFALILAAFPCPILELTRVGFAFATDPFMTSSVVSVRAQPSLTCLGLTTRCTDPSFVLRRRFLHCQESGQVFFQSIDQTLYVP